MRRKLEYLNKGRGGYVVYKDGEGEIQMYFEFGGGHCVAIIDVPSETNWTATTRRPLEERQAILAFVAERAIRDQVPGGYYKLSEHSIEIFKDPVA